MEEMRQDMKVQEDINQDTHEKDDFLMTMALLEADPKIRLLKKYSQHQGNTTYQHCKNVAMTSYQIARHLHIRIDGKALAVGAMLHDYYLYNTKDMDKGNYAHGVGHPGIALKNAEKHFSLTDKERNIILSHMWPLTLRTLPKGREAGLVVIADKYCALREMINGLMNKNQNFG